MVSAAEIALWMLRSEHPFESLIALVEADGDERALAMRHAAERVADGLGAPLVAVAIQRLSLPPEVEPVLDPIGAEAGS
jgi:hypothetical protein